MLESRCERGETPPHSWCCSDAPLGQDHSMLAPNIAETRNGYDMADGGLLAHDPDQSLDNINAA